MNVNDGVLIDVGPDGPASIVVSGAVVSTVNVRVAGVGSTLPAASVARTENVYVRRPAPAERPRRRARGVRAGRGAGTVELALERRRLAAENVNDGAVSPVVPVGPVLIVVSGAAVSTVNVRVAGVGSMLPAVSVARTENVCAPSASAPNARGDVHGGERAGRRARTVELHSNVDGLGSLRT